MTLILSLISPANAILVSDRRLTSSGKTLDEECNKAVVFVCDDARMAIAFTGIAKHGPFNTSIKLLDILMEAGEADHLFVNTVTRFATAMGNAIRILPAPAQQKHLTIVFAGYKYEGPNYRPLLCVVTNVLDSDGRPQQTASDAFMVWWRKNPLGSFGFGKCTGLSQPGRARLHELLAQGIPSVGLVDKAVEMIMNASDSPKSRSLVGKQCTSIILPAEKEQDAIVHYHSATAKNHLQYPSIVHSTSDNSMAVEGLSFQAADNAPPVAIPKVGRNQPCPCGSGKKYKQCCGRL